MTTAHSDAASPWRRGGGAPLRELVAAVLLAVVLLWIWGPTPPIHQDSLQDYYHAKQCQIGTTCPSHSTALPGLRQGRVLLWLLAAMTALGAGFTVHHALFVLLHALAAATVLQLGYRLFGRVAGWGAWAAALYLAPTISEHPILWNPTLAPLPLALFAAALARLASTGSWPWLWIGCLALTFAVHGHPAHYVFAPALAAAAAASAGWAHLAAAVLGPVALLTLIDAAWMEQTLAAAAAAGRVGPVALVLVAAGVCGLLLRRRWHALDTMARARMAAILPGLLLLPAVAVAGVLLGRPVGVRYAAGAVPALALLAGVACARPRRAPALLSRVVVVFLLLSAVGSAGVGFGWANKRLSFSDGYAVVAAAARLGYGVTELCARLQGAYRAELCDLAAIRSGEVAEPKRVEAPPLRFLVVDGERNATAPPTGWHTVALSRGRAGLLSPLPHSVLDTQTFRLCAGLDGGGRPCRAVAPEDRFTAGDGFHRFAVGGSLAWPSADQRERVVAWEQEIDILAAGSGTSTTVLLEPGWQVARVDGASYRLLDSGRGLVLGTAGRDVGTLVIARACRGAEQAPKHAGIAMELVDGDGPLMTVATAAPVE